DVGGIDHRGVQRAVAKNDQAVRVADDGVGAEFGELGNPGKSVFIDLVPEMNGAFATHAEGDHQGQQIDGEIGPGGGLDFRQEVAGEGLLDDEFLSAADDGGIAFVFDLDAEFGEGAHDEVEVVGQRLLDADFAAGDRAEGEEGDDLVVVAVDGDVGAVEFGHAGDGEAGGADAFDLRAHGDEGGAEVLHVGFAGGVDEGGLAGGEGGGHGEVFRDGDGHVVAPVAGTFETVGQRDDEGFAVVDGGAEGGEDVEVGVDLAHAEGAALGVGAHGEFAQAVEKRG